MNLIKNLPYKRDMNRHLGIKTHKCHYNQCDMSFVTPIGLKKHIITSEGQKLSSSLSLS